MPQQLFLTLHETSSLCSSRRTELLIVPSRNLMDLTCSRQILLIHTFKGLARDFLKEMIFNFRGEAVVLTLHTLLRIYGPAVWAVGSALWPRNHQRIERYWCHWILERREWVYMLNKTGLRTQCWGMPWYTSVASSPRITFLRDRHLIIQIGVFKDVFQGGPIYSFINVLHIRGKGLHIPTLAFSNGDI